MESGDSLVNIVTMPIYQDIPKATQETVFSIAPEESIVLIRRILHQFLSFRNRPRDKGQMG